MGGASSPDRIAYEAQQSGLEASFGLGRTSGSRGEVGTDDSRGAPGNEPAGGCRRRSVSRSIFMPINVTTARQRLAALRSRRLAEDERLVGLPGPVDRKG